MPNGIDDDAIGISIGILTPLRRADQRMLICSFFHYSSYETFKRPTIDTNNSIFHPYPSRKTDDIKIPFLFSITIILYWVFYPWSNICSNYYFTMNKNVSFFAEILLTEILYYDVLNLKFVKISKLVSSKYTHGDDYADRIR